MLVHLRVTPSIKFAGTHINTWVERGTVRVKCLAHEHNTMSPARPRTRSTRSGIEPANHEATAPPTRALCSLHFTAKTPAPHHTCGSCWLCIRNLADHGLVFECVTSFYCLLTPFSSKGQKLFMPYLTRHTWLMNNRDQCQFMYCKNLYKS